MVTSPEEASQGATESARPREDELGRSAATVGLGLRISPTLTSAEMCSISEYSITQNYRCVEKRRAELRVRRFVNNVRERERAQVYSICGFPFTKVVPSRERESQSTHSSTTLKTPRRARIFQKKRSLYAGERAVARSGAAPSARPTPRRPPVAPSPHLKPRIEGLTISRVCVSWKARVSQARFSTQSLRFGGAESGSEVRRVSETDSEFTTVYQRSRVSSFGKWTRDSLVETVKDTFAK